jgi:signal transduction histidine kinase
MQPQRHNPLIYGLLLGIWVLIAAWQIEEHIHVREAAKTGLRKRSEAIANTLGAVVRGLQFRGAVFRDRLEPVLGELVASDTNGTASGEVISIALLNAAGEPVAAAGKPIDLEQKDILQVGEHWGLRNMTRVYSVEGAFLNPAGNTNSQAPLILEPRTNSLHGDFRDFPRREPRSDQSGTSNVLAAAATNASDTNAVAPGPGGSPPPPEVGVVPPPGERPGPPPPGEPRPRRPFWARDLNDKQFQELMASRELHGLVLTLSTESLQAVNLDDLWLRCVIIFFAGISAVGSGLAWRNLSKTSELQIRLVRASEMNSHLREMNLAAAGLAHETRNPLNIIRGMAQMLSKPTGASPEDIREKSRAIVNETDKVTAQLNEFINYSRPREIRRSKIALGSAIHEVVRTLAHDIEEKKLQVETAGEPVAIEADEQLLRQVLFNLLLNAIQAADLNGRIQISARRLSATEAVLEVRDNGPGVPPDRRQEIFKPYFTTNQKGTGLGLAVVQQIVLAHGWEIECLANEPKGALFRITHLKVAA